MANRLFAPAPQFLDDEGNPLSGGKLGFFVTGTSTEAITYSDTELTTPNANPVILDSAGRPSTDIFLDPNVTYLVKLTDSNDVLIWTEDPVVDPAAIATASIQVYSGDPNGNVAGNAGAVGGSGASMVYDIANGTMYVCTTSGDAANAVWSDITAGGAATLSGANVFTADQTIKSTDATASEGPTFTLDRDSSSPAANDLLGVLRWLAEDSAGNDLIAAKIVAQLLDATDASEDVQILFQTVVAATLATRMILGQGLQLGSPTGGDPGAGKINATDYEVNGVSIGADQAAAEVTVASAGTCDILGAASERVAISGTTTITSLGTGTNRVRYVRFTGALTLTHNATSLILPGGANITTAAGDTMIVVSDASSNARVVMYQRDSNGPLGTGDSPQFTGLTVTGSVSLNGGGTLGNASGDAVIIKGTTVNAFSSGILDSSSQSAFRTAIGNGTAATQNTGTSGANVPLMNGANTWSGEQTINVAGDTALALQGQGDTAGILSFVMESSNDDDRFVVFVQQGIGGSVGSISVDEGVGVAYVTTSDPRRKNVEGRLDLDECRRRIESVKLHYGTWKHGGSPFRGVLADELQQVIPEAVTGKPGAMEEDWIVDDQFKTIIYGPGENALGTIAAKYPMAEHLHPMSEPRISPQMWDASKCVPDLMGTCQWLMKQNADLCERVARLERQ